MDRLIAQSKLFQVLPYPNRTHSISEGDNTTPHLYSSMTRFLQEQLEPESSDR
jgi:dipeptidyl-peptidase-4